MKILTRQKQVPWNWIFLLTATTGVFSYIENCSGPALTFSIRKFTADPALIAFICSLNVAFNFLVAPFVAWKSDRIWTPVGRRKPFMLIGFALMIPCMLAIPFMPGLASLAIMVVLWQFAMDFGYTGPWSPLLYETVPSHQRGRMVIIKNLITYPLRFLYNLVLIGQFDKVYKCHVGSSQMTITGEFVIYALAALLALLALLNLAFNVREVKPETQLPEERFHLMKYFKEVFGDRQFRMIYLLLICGAFISSSTGAIGTLKVTEQFHYSKQQFGNLKTLEMVITLCLIMPAIAFIVDRFDRFHIFVFGLVAVTLQHLVYWLTIKFLIPGQIPSIPVILVFFVISNSCLTAAMIAVEPLFFDMVPREKMGTLNSGFLLLNGVLSFVLMNAAGWWVKGYTKLFSPPGVVDYLSCSLFLFLVGCLGIVGCWFFHRERQRGHVIFYGKTQQAPEAAVKKLEGEAEEEKEATLV